MKYIIGNINDFSNDEVNAFYKKIPIIKRKKIDKIRNELSRKQSIIGELLLSKLINYNNIDYYINENGKPYLINNKKYFNISHSNDYIVVIISDYEIGIDIEKIRNTNIKNINMFATEKEKEYILSDKKNIEYRLFQIYTLKESYFKMLGTNLNNILEVEFSINKNNIVCSENNVVCGFINDIDGYIISYTKKICH